MKEENTNELEPDGLYSDTPLTDRITEEKAILTPKEQEYEKKELAKAKTDAAIYTIAFVVNIILCLERLSPMFAVIEEHNYYRAMFVLLLSIPTIVSVPAAIFTRIIVNYPVRKGVWFYTEAILFLHIIIVRGLKPPASSLLVFALEMLFCVTATCEIIGYKKGDAFYFIKAVTKALRSKFK